MSVFGRWSTVPGFEVSARSATEYDERNHCGGEQVKDCYSYKDTRAFDVACRSTAQAQSWET